MNEERDIGKDKRNKERKIEKSNKIGKDEVKCSKSILVINTTL